MKAEGRGRYGPRGPLGGDEREPLAEHGDGERLEEGRGAALQRVIHEEQATQRAVRPAEDHSTHTDVRGRWYVCAWAVVRVCVCVCGGACAAGVVSQANAPT